jgi:hypothetical protein
MFAQAVALGDGLTQLMIDLARRHIGPVDSQRATQMPLTNRASPND